MDFDQAIAAHALWKQKLAAYLRKPDGSLKVSDLAVDNKCALGQWIYGEGSKHSKLTEYSTLKNEHARFHKAAAEVVKRADSGQSVTEETALGSKSEFRMASEGVVSAIMGMRNQEMDFDQAIAAHALWKQKLAAYLRKPDGSLKPPDLAVDNKCPLGQWIHGEAVRYSKLAEYSALKSEHARFHKAVAEVVKRADSGQSVTEETALGSKSEFRMASEGVVSAIITMKARAGK